MADKTTDEIRELMLKFEKERDPFKYQMEGTCIWPILRFSVFENLLISKEKFDQRGTKPLQDILRKLFLAPVIALRECFKIIMFALQKKEIIFFGVTSTNRFRDYIDGEYKNVYFDFFEPPLDSLILWNDQRHYHKKEATMVKPSVISGIIWRFFLPIGYWHGKKHKDQITALHNDLTEFLSKTADPIHFPLTRKNWESRIANHLSKKYLFRFVLKIFHPKIVLLEPSFGQAWAIAAARSLKIPVWELQHGIVYDGHMGYTYDKFPATKYKKKLPLPDKILTFGEYSSEILLERGFWTPEEVAEIGFARMEYFQKKFPPMQNFDTNRRLNLLITTQWILSSKTIDFLKEAFAQLKVNVSIIIKPHPLEPEENRRRYKELGNNVEIAPDKEELYQLLARSHMLCSVFSTTLFESIGMGVPTLLINLPGAQNADVVLKHQCARIAENPKHFAEIISQAQNTPGYLKDWQTKTMEKRTLFWRPNASQNLYHLIKSELTR